MQIVLAQSEKRENFSQILRKSTQTALKKKRLSRFFLEKLYELNRNKIYNKLIINQLPPPEKFIKNQQNLTIYRKLLVSLQGHSAGSVYRPRRIGRNGENIKSRIRGLFY